MRLSNVVPVGVVGGLVVALAASWTAPSQAQHSPEAAHGPAKAVAVLIPTKGSTVQGTISFAKVEGGVHVTGTITGLTPGKHGFHIHEFGDASSSDGMSAGGHFNPEKKAHGNPSAGGPRHVGDLGNIEADESGKAVVDIKAHHLAFHGAESILGRGLVVHAKPDDFSQPVGNAGPRAAVGVIGVAK